METLPRSPTASGIVTRQGDMASVAERKVSVGVRLNGLAEISSGLSAGEEVVLRGVHSLTDGQAVGERVAP